MIRRNLLLDTSVLIGWLSEPDRLKPETAALIADPATAINGSVVNLWEMQITSRLGKPDLTMPLGAIHDWIVNQEGWALLPVRWPHIRRLNVLDCPYKDPFDRLLIAQALGEQVRCTRSTCSVDGLCAVARLGAVAASSITGPTDQRRSRGSRWQMT